MDHILSGIPVAKALQEENARIAAGLRERGIVPALAILQVGSRPDAMRYAQMLQKKSAECGIDVKLTELAQDAPQAAVCAALEMLNGDPAVHGILLMRPLPEGMDEEGLRNRIRPEKDVDSATDASLAGVFTSKPLGFAPATPQAVLEILRYYGIPLRGKKVVVVGRSLVVGRPLAMLLLAQDATVTICHSKTENLPQLTREADIVVAALAKPEALGADCFRKGQIVVDVGIHRRGDGSFCGDVAFSEAEPLAQAITPVPGGVGSVTTAVMLRHVVQAAENKE